MKLMPAFFSQIYEKEQRKTILKTGSILIAYNILIWIWAYYYLHTSVVLMGSAVLAYTFGLRHAVDADHIAAIDNVTRKLMHDGKNPILAGLYFSLGHSAVVLLAFISVAFMASTLTHHLFRWNEWGQILSTSLSAIFLGLIAMVNFKVLMSLFQVLKKASKDRTLEKEACLPLMTQSGLVTRHFKRIFQVITKSWHMFPLGFLLGIGFDTASEIMLLGIAASETTQGISLSSMFIFPALFTAGMTLVDTADSVVMVGAYGWAFPNPMRKLYYNLTMTLISVVVALVVGCIEALGILGNVLHHEGVFWDAISQINQHFNQLGYMIIFVFIVSWLVSILVYKLFHGRSLSSSN